MWFYFRLPISFSKQNISITAKKVRPYKKINFKLLDIYEDDLSIYLEFNRSNKKMNENNDQEALSLMDTFYKWSGLKLNRVKKQITMLS